MKYVCLILFLSAGLSLTGLCFLVLLKAPPSLRKRVFVLGLITLAIPQFAYFFSAATSYEPSALFWARFSFIGSSFVPVTWTLVSLTFAHQNHQRLGKKWRLLSLLLGFLGLAFLAFIPSKLFIKSIEIEELTCRFLFGPVGRYFHIFLLASTLIILVNLESIFRQASKEEKEAIKYAWLGMTGIFVFYLYVVSLALLFSSIELQTLAARAGTIIISTLLIAYSMLKHKAMDVNIYIARQVVYTSTTVLLAGIYLICVGIITYILKALGAEFRVFFMSFGAFILLFLLVIALLNEPLRRRISNFIDRSFYTHRYDYRHEWEKFTERTSSVADLQQLLSSIIDVVTDTLYIHKASIMLFNEQAKEFYVAASRNLLTADLNAKLKAESLLVKWLKESRKPLVVSSALNDPKIAEICREMENQLKEVALCLPLISNGTLIGMLNLSEKHSKEKFYQEDLELLKTISKQAAIAVANAQLSNQLIVSKEIESFHRVSSFVMHDLKNFISMLSMIVQSAATHFDNPEFQQDVLKTISATVSKMKDLMTKLSTTTKKLDLNLQPVDLNKLIEETIEKSKIDRASKATLIQNLNGLEPVKADYEYLRQVILNLLLNALEALPDGGEIKVQSYQSDEFAHIVIADTGIGMSREFIAQHLFKPFQSTKKKGLGIGLYQCKEIVDAHGGTIEIESEEGKGTKVTLRLPTL